MVLLQFSRLKKKKERSFIHLVSQYTLGSDDLIKDVLTHMGIHSRQRIIQQIDISFPVYSTSQTHPLLLTSGQIQTLRTASEF